MRGSIRTEMSGDYRKLQVMPAILHSYRTEFREMTMANKAHTVMLCDCGIIGCEAAGSILAALEDIDRNLREEDLTDEVEDFYFNVEKALIDRVGQDVGGRMHTARSRNDLGAGIARMVTRKTLLGLMDGALALRRTILDLADRNIDTVMTGYTHLQPAQPTTLGHFLTAYAQVLGRDIDRLAAAYKVTNLSPFGAGAFAGTGFPINRRQVSDLLGFDDILENTWDCVSSRDYLLQIESACAILLSTLSRVGQDIYVWCTNEFGVYKLGGEIANQSSIMPQKVNPAIVEFMRAKSGHAMAAFTSTFVAVNKSPYSLCCDLHEGDTLFPKGAEETLRAMEMMRELLKFASFDGERAEEMARRNFSTVTELADHLVRVYDISFRDAHHIVGGMVADAREAGADVRGMTSRSLATWSERIVGRAFDIDNEELFQILEPRPNVQSKTLPGGPATGPVGAMIDRMRRDLKCQQAFLDEAADRIDAAYQQTEAEAVRILSLGAGTTL